MPADVMPRVDLLVANPGHHTASVVPVVDRLEAVGVRCRLLSLCGVRGRPQPDAALEGRAAELRPLGPQRRPASAGAAIGGVDSRRRRWLREVAWWTTLAPAVRLAMRDRPDLVVVPNDVAYPYGRIVEGCRRRRLPVVLLQEGIRFELPIEAVAYGSRSDALAVWGEGSADHFRACGIDPAAIHVTGAPRFDALPSSPAAPRFDLAIVTNPIDAQGLCSTREKVDLVARFINRLPEGRRVTLSCHPGERPDDYLTALAPADRDRVRQAEGVDAVLASHAAVVVLASTVGLEALAAGRGLGVLPIPGHGYAFDYVERQAGVPLDPDADIERQVDRLLAPTEDQIEARTAYLGLHLAHRGAAGEQVARLIMTLLER